MAGSVDDDIVAQYAGGDSLTLVAKARGLPIYRVRLIVKTAGALRSHADGVRLAAEQGRLGSGLRGKKRVFTDEHKEKIRQARLAWGEAHAKGFSERPSGYIEHTRGPDKGRGQHRTIVENRIGRRLSRSEHVHHADEVRSNNADDNLTVLPIVDHMRLHRLQEIAAGKIRERDEHGRYR